MKKLQIPNETNNGIPPRKYGKDGLIQDIQEWIGKDGYIPMEHGFRPTFNTSAFDYNGVILRFPIGKEKRRRIDYTEMDEQMLTDVILTLFRYYNWCHLYA